LRQVSLLKYVLVFRSATSVSHETMIRRPLRARELRGAVLALGGPSLRGVGSFGPLPLDTVAARGAMAVAISP